MAITKTENFGFTIQQSGAAASDKFSMAALNENATIADEVLKNHEDALAKITFKTGEQIAENTDLNNIKELGVYFSPTAAISETLLNAPTKAYGFRLEVREIISNTRIAQWLYPNAKGVFYTRNLLTAGWSNWYKFSGEEIIPSDAAAVSEVTE